MPVTTEQKRPRQTVEEELQRIKAGKPEGPRRSNVNRTIGVIEMVAGALAIVFSFAAGVVLSVLLGAVIALAGILQMAASAFLRAPGRFIIGLAAAVTGIFFIANPLVSLATLSLAVGAYLIASGIIDVAAARRQGVSTGSGVLQVIVGVLALTGAVGLGVLAGSYLIIRGIFTYQTAQEIRK